MQRLRRLAARRVDRWEAQLFVAEGPKLLEEALRAGAGVESVFVDLGSAGEGHRELAERAASAGASVHEVEPGVIDRVCQAVSPQPIAAIVSMLHVPLGSLALEGHTVVCTGMADPGNAGTVIRSAAASGSGAVVFCAGAVDIYNPKTVRASAGSLFLVPVVAGDDADADTVLDHLGSRSVTRVATVARGGEPHDRFDWSGRTALVLGSESHGLPVRIQDRIDATVTIPMESSVESLNVAMAATVICFEAARQRRASQAGAA